MPISADAIARAEHDVVRELTCRLPLLVSGYRQLVQQATQIVGRRLADAAAHEGVSPAELSEAAHRQLGNCVANYALALLGAQQRRHRLAGVEGASGDPRTAVDWVRRRRAASPGWSGLAFFEQWVIDGHPLHPATKVRVPMTPAEVIDTSPEWGNVVPLAIAALHGDIATEHGADHRAEPSTTDRGALTALLLAEHPQLRPEYAAAAGRGQTILLPVHPWQADRVLPDRYSAELAAGSIELLRATVPARPLVSYRTFAPVGSDSTPHPHHLKTSLSVRLTNAMRGVSPASARNGPANSALLSRLLRSDEGLGGRFDILAEPAAAHFRSAEAFGDANGLSRESALSALARRNPEAGLGACEVLLPTGALWARSPMSDEPILAELLDELCSPTLHKNPAQSRADAAERFADAYADLVVPPLLTLLTRFGIALEAHGENTLLVVDAGSPVRCIVRDLGGIRINPARLATQGLHADLAPGSKLATHDDRELRNKLYYAAFVNDARQLVATLVGLSGRPASVFWRPFRAAAESTFCQLRRDPSLRAVVESDSAALLRQPWPNKALLSMWLRGAVTDYTYLPMTNPLA